MIFFFFSSMCLPCRLWTSQGKGSLPVYLIWLTVGVNKWPEMDRWTNGWRFPLGCTAPSLWGWKQEGRSNCNVRCKPSPPPHPCYVPFCHWAQTYIVQSPTLGLPWAGQSLKGTKKLQWGVWGALHAQVPFFGCTGSSFLHMGFL